jgi:hypothetical protein
MDARERYETPMLVDVEEICGCLLCTTGGGKAAVAEAAP